MTGFGSASIEQNGWACTAEVRSVNQRFLDLRVRLPQGFQGLEGEFREQIKQVCARGKVECSLKLEGASGTEEQWTINASAAEQLHQALARFEEQTGRAVTLNLRDLTQVPGLLEQKQLELSSEAGEGLLRKALTEALQVMQQMREREGQALQHDVTSRLSRCQGLVQEISGWSSEIPSSYHKRLEENLAAFTQGSGLPEERLLQEVALMADKVDISEELVRFETHVQHMTELLAQPNSGKKAEFLLQELNREVNTMASKSGHAGISRATVEIKSELEKIREQIQNIE